MTEQELIVQVNALQRQLNQYAQDSVKHTLFEDDDAIFDEFCLCVGNGPGAQEWKHDELLAEIAQAKLQRELEECRKVAVEKYLQQIATTKFP